MPLNIPTKMTDRNMKTGMMNQRVGGESFKLRPRTHPNTDDNAAAVVTSPIAIGTTSSACCSSMVHYAPPCGVDRYVGAKYVSDVVNQLIESGDRRFSHQLSSDGAMAVDDPYHQRPASTSGADHRFAVDAPSVTPPPPLPLLPWWFTPDAEKRLENGKVGDVIDGEDHLEYVIELAPTEPGVIPIQISPSPDYMPPLEPLQIQVETGGGYQVRPCSFDPAESPEDYGSGPPTTALPLDAASCTAATSVVHSPRSPEELRGTLKHQLEYYFSRENLATDRYLRSQMDNDQYVPIRTIAGFPKVKRLTSDIELIIQTLRQSPLVQVDEKGDKVRPSAKRCTIILREIPAETEKKEVETMFIDRRCPPLVSCERTLNNSWYVSFDTEEDTQRAQMHLQMNVRNFKGKPIFSRIKTGAVPLTTPTGGGTPSPQAPSIANDSGIAENNSNGHGTGGTPTPVVQNGYAMSLGRPDSFPDPLGYEFVGETSAAGSNCALPGGYMVVSPPYAQSSVYSSSVPHFDLGTILWQRGWIPQATYRPGPSTIVQVPPSQFRSVMNVTTAGASAAVGDPVASQSPIGGRSPQGGYGMSHSGTFPIPYAMQHGGRLGGGSHHHNATNPNRLSPQPLSVNSGPQYRSRNNTADYERGGRGRRPSPHHGNYSRNSYSRGIGNGRGANAYGFNQLSQRGNRGGGLSSMRGSRRGVGHYYCPADNGYFGCDRRSLDDSALGGGRHRHGGGFTTRGHDQHAHMADRFDFPHYDNKVRGRGGLSSGRRFGAPFGAKHDSGSADNKAAASSTNGGSALASSRRFAPKGRNDGEQLVTSGSGVIRGEDDKSGSGSDNVDEAKQLLQHEEFDFDPDSFPELTPVNDGSTKRRQSDSGAFPPLPSDEASVATPPSTEKPSSKQWHCAAKSYPSVAVTDDISSKNPKFNESVARVSAVKTTTESVELTKSSDASQKEETTVVDCSKVSGTDAIDCSADVVMRPTFSSVASGKSSAKDFVVTSPKSRNALSSSTEGGTTTDNGSCFSQLKESVPSPESSTAVADVPGQPKRLSYAQMARQKSSSATSSSVASGGRQAPSPDSALSDPTPVATAGTIISATSSTTSGTMATAVDTSSLPTRQIVKRR